MNKATQAILKEEIKALAATATAMRRREQKAHGASRFNNNPDIAEYISGIQSYRTKELRPFSRYYQLAYAFLRNVPYSAVEQSVRAGNEVNETTFKDVLNALGFDSNVVAYADVWLTAE